MTSDLRLPHWETIPTDVADATRAVKRAIRAEIERHGTTVEAVVAEAEAFLRSEIADIERTRSTGGEVWPIVEFTDIEAGNVSAGQIANIKRRGCVVVRNTFERAEAEGWDRAIVDYVDTNQFFEQYRGPGDDFFETVQSKPEIYPIY